MQKKISELKYCLFLEYLADEQGSGFGKANGARSRTLPRGFDHPAHDRREVEDRDPVLHSAARCAAFWRAATRIGTISESTLSKQLRELVADGMLERIEHGQVPPNVEYVLTKQGESFVPILVAMKTWGEEQLGL